MDQIKRYRIPILTGVGALLFAIVIFAAWISPEGGKLSALHAQQTQLESQQIHLQTELTTLKAQKAHLASNCQALSKDLGLDFAGYFSAELEGLADLEQDGLLRRGAGGLVVSDVGRLFIRNIAMRFDRYLPGVKERRFSKTI